MVCHPTLHTLSSSYSNRSAHCVGLLCPALHPPPTSIPDILMCSLSLLSLSVNGYAQEKSNCLQSLLQHTKYTSHKYNSMQPMLCESLRRHWASHNHCVQFRIGHARQNTKLTYGRDEFTSHSTRTTENRRMCVQSCHAQKLDQCMFP